MVRLPLLYLYGGVRIHNEMMLIRHLDDMCWNALKGPSTPYESAGASIESSSGATNMHNELTEAKRGNGLIKSWHVIHMEVRKDGRTEHTGSASIHCRLIYRF